MSIDRLIAIAEIHNKVITAMDLGVVHNIADAIARAFGTSNKVLIAGCGGSAADAQHLAAELVGRFHRERIAMPAIALTTDTSILTAVGNDYGFDQIFARQIEALGRSGDVFIAISTSGKTVAIQRAIRVAQAKGLRVILFTGQRGVAAVETFTPDYALVAPSESVARIQEAHGLAIHMICHLLDEWFHVPD